jgi:hypothetical protein
VHLEKAREQHARGVGEVRASTALDLREITLTDGFIELGANEPGDFLLGEFAVEAAKSAFDLPEVPKLFAEPHIAIRDYYIAICNQRQGDCASTFPAGFYAFLS